MIIIENKIIPFKGFKVMNLFGILFVRKPNKLDKVDINHEAIHSRLMIELLWIFFYLIYGIEWIIRLIQYKDKKKAYRNISFEREAYLNEYNLNYLKERKWYGEFRSSI